MHSSVFVRKSGYTIQIQMLEQRDWFIDLMGLWSLVLLIFSNNYCFESVVGPLWTSFKPTVKCYVGKFGLSLAVHFLQGRKNNLVLNFGCD